MSSYATLYDAIGTKLVAEGYTPAPSGPDGERIPAHGADTWVAIDLQPRVGNTSGGVAREAHELTLQAITSRQVDQQVAYSSAVALALALRKVFDDPAGLMTAASAQAEPQDPEIEIMPGRYLVSVPFIIHASTTI